MRPAVGRSMTSGRTGPTSNRPTSSLTVYCSDFVVEGDEQDYRIWQSSVCQGRGKKELSAAK